MSQTATKQRSDTESQQFGYRVLIDGESLITLRSRHAAIGLVCVFLRSDHDSTASVEATPHTNTNNLPGLRKEPARAESP